MSTDLAFLSPQQAIFLFVAGILGGALNAVAGGGSFVAFPALLLVGVPPIPANATNTLALWTGVTASGGAYRNRLDVPQRVLLPLLATSLVGGIIGHLRGADQEVMKQYSLKQGIDKLFWIKRQQVAYFLADADISHGQT